MIHPDIRIGHPVFVRAYLYILSYITADRGPVDRERYRGVHCHCTACYGCRCRPSIRRSGIAYSDLRFDVPDLCVTADLRFGSAGEVRHRIGGVDRCDSRSNADVDGHDLAEVHTGTHAEASCGSDVTCHLGDHV